MRVLSLLLSCCVLAPCAQAQWEIQASHTGADLRAVHAVSDQVAWASGAQGTVLRTADGGATWERCAMPAEASALDFHGVQGFDAKTALVMSSGKGELSRVYKTVDACKTWELVFTNPNPDGTLDALQFQWKTLPAPQKGYYATGVLVGHPVAGEFVIYTSKDHGSTWGALREDEAFSPGPPAVAKDGEQVFSASNTALTATADEDSFAFVTGGTGGPRLLYPESHHQDFNYVSVKYTFSDVQLPMPVGASAGAYSVAARRVSPDRVDLMVVGGDPNSAQAGSAVFVRHGGPTLNVKKIITRRAVAAEQQPSGYRTAVAYNATANEWITVGPNGTDVSHDDGRTWTPLHPGALDAQDADKNWQALSLPFAVGPNGRIGKLRGSNAGPAMLAGR